MLRYNDGQYIVMLIIVWYKWLNNIYSIYFIHMQIFFYFIDSTGYIPSYINISWVSVLPGQQVVLFSLWWWVVFGFERIVRYPRKSSLVFVLFFCCNYQKSVKRIAGKNLNLSWMYHCGYWKNLPWLEQRRLNTKYSKFIFNENYCKNRCIALYPCRSGGRIYARIYYSSYMILY